MRPITMRLTAEVGVARNADRSQRALVLLMLRERALRRVSKRMRRR